MIKTPTLKLKKGKIYCDTSKFSLLSTIIKFVGNIDGEVRFKYVLGYNDYGLIDEEIRFNSSDLSDTFFYELNQKEIKTLVIK